MKFGVIDSGSGLSAGTGESAATGLGKLNDREEYNENRRIEISSIVVANTVDSSKRRYSQWKTLGSPSLEGRNTMGLHPRDMSISYKGSAQI